MAEHKHHVNIDNNKIDKGFDMLDDVMLKMVNELKLSFFEVLTILSMMETKLKRNNIDQYLLETVTRFQEKLNEEDEKGR